ncbi:HIT-like protein [Lactarius hatsudake]|nr:HIT-like protein [Lactarius hatsudake]
MSSAVKSLSTCIFCKIIKGEIPSFKLLETEFTFSFLDMNPLSKGHSLVIPKFHGEKLHDVPDEYLADTLSIAKKIAIAQGAENYNILQNNGRIAHQEVDHVHFHVIPKPSASKTEGLVVEWPQQTMSKEELAEIHAELKGKL